MREAAPQLEKVLTRIAVLFVLRNRVGHSLLREAVLQLEGCHGQAVDENGEVKSKGTRAFFLTSLRPSPGFGEFALG